MNYISRVLASVILISSIAHSVSAQVSKSNWQGMSWTNGIEQYDAIPINNQVVFLAGTGYYDEGYGYAYKVKATGKYGEYQLTGINSSSVKLPENINMYVLSKSMADSNLFRQMYQGVDVLVVKNEKGVISDVFTPIDPGKCMIDHKMIALRELLCGDPNVGITVYNSTDGTKYTFKDDYTCVFEGQKMNFKLCYDDDVPMNIIELEAGGYYYFEITKDGIDLYNAGKMDDSEKYVRSDLYKHLYASKNSPRWKYFSDMVINKSYLWFNSEVLRIMRNEIYARKGYKFSDKALDEYFRTCSWYKPGNDNSKIKLEPIETLNVALIKYVEEHNDY